jgi:hypothetical protein
VGHLPYSSDAASKYGYVESIAYIKITYACLVNDDNLSLRQL